MSIFHAYDIRGRAPQEITPAIAEAIGRAVATHLNIARIVVGRDMRATSPVLEEALINGLLAQGVDVVEIGLCSTALFYWATRDEPAGIMVTASHNPAEYNGFKICRQAGFPVGEETGLREIAALVESRAFPQATAPGTRSSRDVLDAYLTWSLAFLTTRKSFRIVVDAANGMGGFTYHRLRSLAPRTIELIPMYFELDGNFPNHEANPLKEETLAALRARVVGERADLGIALDGDADRVVFVDNAGVPIPADLATALLARAALAERPGAQILYDIRSSWACAEEIRAAGGIPVMTRVGHSFIKLEMRKRHAAFGGEVSGHYYHAACGGAENTELALFRLLNLLDAADTDLASLVAPLRRYAKIPETNFTVPDPRAAVAQIDAILAARPDVTAVSRIDGVRVEFPDWWCNVRASNTEPLLRLNLEAKTPAQRDTALAYVRSLIPGPQAH